MDCPVCFFPYDLLQHLPKVFPCGHTVCADCTSRVTSGARLDCPVCRVQCISADVRVNFALRDALPGVTGSTNAPRLAPPREPADLLPPADASEVDVLLKAQIVAEALAVHCDAHSNAEVLVSITPPVGTIRAPADICCVVDVSESMGNVAMIRDSEGTANSHGLSMLDIVKHALRTIIYTLGPRDRIALVSFESRAEMTFGLTTTTNEGKKYAAQQLETLQVGGLTNLWQGLEMGVKILGDDHNLGRLRHLMLLTDGVPTMSPPRGEQQMLQKLRDKASGALPCTVSTFGFGYELDSDLLSKLSVIGSGSYAFIPDPGLVGTVFVNAMSNLLVTMATNVKLNLVPLSGSSLTAEGIIGGHPTKTTNKGIEVDLGTLQFGQCRNVLVRLALPPDTDAGELECLNMTLKYRSRASHNLHEVTAAMSCTDVIPKDEVAWDLCRFAFLDGVQRAMGTLKLTQLDKVRGKQLPLQDSQRSIQELANTLSILGRNGSEPVDAILEDLQGQVAEALSREDWYHKWGIHYLPSLLSAHRSQQCNNFKDPGVQQYGGDVFQEVRELADAIFLSLPPPVPTFRPKLAAPAAQSQQAQRTDTISTRAAAPASMAAYYDRYAGCINGTSHILLADRSLQQACKVKRGDLVESLDGSIATVVCVVRTHVVEGQLPLVQLPGGLQLTPYHPVLTNGAWQFPADLRTPKLLPCEAVYTFVLDGGDAVIAGSCPCISLGHSLQEGAAKHEYFGSTRVVKDLRKFPGFSNGLVDLLPGSVVRSPVSGQVCKLVPSADDDENTRVLNLFKL